MIRVSKHNITDIGNEGKLASLRNLLSDYKVCLSYYIDLIVNGSLVLKTNLSSKDLPTVNITHSRYKQLIYKQASEIIRGNIKKSNDKRYHKYKKIYKYMMENHPDSPFCKRKYKELNLKDIIETKYFIKPNIQNITINLDERFFNIELGKYFDCFVNIKLPFFNDKGTRAIQTNIPLKYHKHSNKLKDNGFSLKNTIQLKSVNDKIYINLIWFKEEVKKKDNGDVLGVDMGVNKLLACSNGNIIGDDMSLLYDKINKKQRGSKNYKELLTYRDNLTNYYVNQLNLTDVKSLVIEDLKNVKHKTKLGRKNNTRNSRWVYPSVIAKLERICEELGITLVKVSPAYTSQTCSSCGTIDENSRNGEEFKCVSCGHTEDADVNASINIRNRGEYSPSDEKRKIFT